MPFHASYIDCISSILVELLMRYHYYPRALLDVNWSSFKLPIKFVFFLQGGRGSSSHKNGITKVSKQLALAFAKRTIARCHRFEETGRSCFSEPTLRDVILSAPLHNIDSKHSDVSGAINHVESRSGHLGSRVSGMDFGCIILPSL